MAEDCNKNCKTCSSDCKERDFKERLNDKSSVKNVIAIVSGKGGVGKSLVTSLLATTTNRMGYRTAILDADITGPTIPKAFGIKGQSVSDGTYMYPLPSNKGVQVMSINLLLNDETEPVIWRGPIIAGTVKQFWTDVVWDDVDYMFVDMPPGTGDVPLTVFQSLPVKGIIIVTSPQDIVSMIVKKAVNMAKKMNVPVLGIVENMSYFICDDCNKEHKIFGESKVLEIAKEYNIEKVARIPIDMKIASLCDNGNIEDYTEKYLDELLKY